MIPRSTTHGNHMHEEPSTIDQAINSPAWRKDSLIGLGGPMTRSRAKKMNEALNGIIQQLLIKAKPKRVRDKPTFVSLFKVDAT